MGKTELEKARAAHERAQAEAESARSVLKTAQMCVRFAEEAERVTYERLMEIEIHLQASALAAAAETKE